MGRKRFKSQPWEMFPCPRCESPDTRFFCYNGRDGTKPKHYCNACSRYWIRGGTLRQAKRVPRAKAARSSSSSSAMPRAREAPSTGAVDQEEAVKPLDISTWVDEELNRALQEELWAVVSNLQDELWGGPGTGEEGEAGFRWDQQPPPPPLLHEEEEPSLSSLPSVTCLGTRWEGAWQSLNRHTS